DRSSVGTRITRSLVRVSGRPHRPSRLRLSSKGALHMPVIRISNARFDAARSNDAERLLEESEGALRDALTRLPGLIHYYVGIDRVRGSVTNVSVWDSLE